MVVGEYKSVVRINKIRHKLMELKINTFAAKCAGDD